MTLKEKILYYQQKGTPKTEAIKQLKRETRYTDKKLFQLWSEVKEEYYIEEQKRRKKGTGRQVTATGEDRIICKAITTFGADNQKRIAQEELAELIQAISKEMRGRPHNVEEEIADVEIMLEQLKRIYDKEKVRKWKENKLKRLNLRIKEAK